MEALMKSYAVAHLRDVDFNEQIADYLRRIDATLEPFGGRFLVHGGRVHPLEGDFDATMVMLEFPSLDAARDWYHSPAYQDILPLRTGNSPGSPFSSRGWRRDTAAWTSSLRSAEGLAPVALDLPSGAGPPQVGGDIDILGAPGIGVHLDLHLVAVVAPDHLVLDVVALLLVGRGDLVARAFQFRGDRADLQALEQLLQPLLLV